MSIIGKGAAREGHFIEVIIIFLVIAMAFRAGETFDALADDTRLTDDGLV